MPTWRFQTLRSIDRTPIAGARVALRVRLGRHESHTAEATTDAEGCCEIGLTLPEGLPWEVTVIAGAAGHGACLLGLDDTSPGARTVLHLEPGPTIRGRVTQDGGDPVAGATVRLRTRNLDGTGERELLDRDDWPPPATTDTDGCYVLTWFRRSWQGQPEGTDLVLTVEHPGFQAWVRPRVQEAIPGEGEFVVDARLSPRRDIPEVDIPEVDTPEVPTHEADTPESEWRVPLRLQIMAGAPRRPVTGGDVHLSLEDRSRFSFRLRIGPDGITEERFVPIGDYRAQVRVPGMACRHARLRVDGSDQGLPRVVHVSRGRTVSGRVTDRHGKPVAGCHVSFANMRAHATPEGSTQTDAQGHYTLTGVRGLCWLSFLAPGFLWSHRIRWVPGWVPSWVPGWVPWKRRMDVILSRGCRVHGTVVDENGAPCPSAFVQLHSRGPGAKPVDGWSAWTDAEGRFEFSHVPNGPATLLAMGDQQKVVCGDETDVVVGLRARASASANARANASTSGSGPG